MKAFNEYSTLELVELIQELHLNKKLSIRAIAKELKTYPLKICRFCTKHQIPVMTAAESLQSGYEQDRIKSARKGLKLSEEECIKISEAQFKFWQNISEEDRQARSKKQSEIFSEREDKNTFSRKGSQAIRRAVDDGSKLEKVLIKEFESRSIEYIHHYKGIFGNSNLEADFFLPEYNLVIEVDGPSHFTNNFGTDKYSQQMEADQKKNGLVLSQGSSIIRVQHHTALCKRDYRLIIESLFKTLDINNELKVINVKDLRQDGR